MGTAHPSFVASKKPAAVQVATRSWAQMAGGPDKVKGDVDVSKPLPHRMKKAALTVNPSDNLIPAGPAKGKPATANLTKTTNYRGRAGIGATRKKQPITQTESRKISGPVKANNKDDPVRRTCRKCQTLLPTRKALFTHVYANCCMPGSAVLATNRGSTSAKTTYIKDRKGAPAVGGLKPAGSNEAIPDKVEGMTKPQVPQTPVIEAAVDKINAQMSVLELPSPVRESTRKIQSIGIAIPMTIRRNLMTVDDLINTIMRPTGLRKSGTGFKDAIYPLLTGDRTFTTYYPAARGARGVTVAIPFAFKPKPRGAALSDSSSGHSGKITGTKGELVHSQAMAAAITKR
ncbi:hypothetical protein V8F20_012315 [Naviculisporaceae sp. PSN 640]